MSTATCEKVSNEESFHRQPFVDASDSAAPEEIQPTRTSRSRECLGSIIILLHYTPLSWSPSSTIAPSSFILLQAAQVFLVLSYILHSCLYSIVCPVRRFGSDSDSLCTKDKINFKSSFQHLKRVVSSWLTTLSCQCRYLEFFPILFRWYNVQMLSRCPSLCCKGTMTFFCIKM